MRSHIIKAVAKKNLATFFNNPAGYLFISIFIVACSIFQFSWGEQFFIDNLAELSTLNHFFPYLLLFFIPVLTMNSWAEERKLGTDEFLLTLPATDGEIISGKYLSLLGVYTSSLVLSVSLLVILSFIGSPDLGLAIGNYLSYLILGACLISAGMVASQLTSNATVAFILGVLINSILMFAGHIIDAIKGVFTNESQGAIESSGLLAHFQEMATGIISLEALFYYLVLTLILLYLNLILVTRRHWSHSQQEKLKLHFTLRVIALLVIMASASSLLNRAAVRADLTSENIHSFSSTSKELLKKLKNPLIVEAYVSPEVPSDFVETRRNLLSNLREIQALSGGKVRVTIHEPLAQSKEARDAQDRYSIRPQTVRESRNGQVTQKEIILAAAISSGARQEVIPFFSRGLNSEYELIRTLRVVSEAQRKRIGLLSADINMRGGFDFHTRSQQRPWEVVAELEKQYEVVDVSAGQDIPKDIDALLAVMPSSLAQEDMDRLQDYILNGGKTLLLCDPAPLANLQLSPHLPKPNPNQNPMMGGRGPAPTPKGNFTSFLQELGLELKEQQIAFNIGNSHPELSHLPPEFVFSSKNLGAYNSKELSSAHLQETVFLYPGVLASEGWTQFTPLISLKGEGHGTAPWNQLFQPNFMGSVSPAPQGSYVERRISSQEQVIAAHISGERTLKIEKDIDESTDSALAEDAKSTDKKQSVNTIIIADTDFIGDQFFGLRREGIRGLNFDNISFFLNCIDQLAGDQSFVELRSKRRSHRPLKSFDDLRKGLNAELNEIIAKSEAEGNQEMDNFRSELEAGINKLRQNDKLKMEDKERQVQTMLQLQASKLQAREAEIELERSRKVREAQEKMAQQIKKQRDQLIMVATVVPPLLPLLIALMVYLRRRKRESLNISSQRRKEA